MGLQIILTGLLVCALMLGIIKMDDRSVHVIPFCKVATVVLTLIAGYVAIVVGFFMMIWGY